jgi:P4 family phage/plasmid primase-like protien
MSAAHPYQPLLRSDVQIAKAMAEAHAADKNAEGRIWRFRDRRWQAILEDELHREAMRYDSEAAPLSKGRVDSIIACLGYELGDDLEFFAGRIVGINCASGLITFAKDGQPSLSRSHDREHRQRHLLAGQWQPGAASEPPEGSLLATYLRGAFASDPEAEEKIGLLQEIAGVAALGYGTRLTSPKAVILLGRTAENGKSQFLDMLIGLLPPNAVCSVPPERLGDDNKIVLLAGGALLNVSGELSGAIASERFKAVITGDLLDARKAYGRDTVLFRAEAQHVYAANQLPPFRGGMDAGVRRRLLVVEFLRTIPPEERIPDIGKRIAHEEPDALLAWAVEGARRVIARGHFLEPASSKRALEEWTQTADAVAGWIADRVLPPIEGAAAEPARVSSADAFADFRLWCMAEEGQATRMKQRRFTEDLQGAGLPGVRYIPGQHGFRGFEGLRLKEQTPAMRAARPWSGASGFRLAA